MKQQNIIIILLDGARHDSLKLLTSFNAWTKKGTTFSKMITYGPQTVTAIHALLSGMNGNRSGANNYYGILNFKKKLCKTLPQYLKESNYTTSADVLQDIVLPNQGFDSITLHDEKKDDIVQKHVNLIKQHAELRKQNKNFFLFLQYSPIHTYVVHEVLKKYDYDDYNSKYFNNPEKNLEEYNKIVSNTGKYLDKIMQTSEELGLFKDTLFILFSDHGASVGEKEGELGYGRFCYDYTIKSFATFIQPEFFPEQKEVKKLSRIIDFFPTILDVLNIPESPMPLKIQGKSLFPLIQDEPDERIALSEASGVEQKPTNIPPRIHSIRTPNWKLIYNTETKEKEIYNLEEDPKEKQNLIGTNPEKEKELFKKLLELNPSIN
ncbi:sulfatase-like hydrolase/transferase [Candidatus Pacearchaeota archaeon]|nr:sulfatase-like hydrolase/transferase [Candidatus Pacearchaeota archaeon]